MEDDPSATTTPPAETLPSPPPEVTEAEGEEIKLDDPQALHKFQLRSERLARERDEAREESRARAQKEVQMDEETRTQLATLTTERDTARSELGTARDETASLRTQLALTGKVNDVEAATRLAGGDFRKEDGSLDVDALLTRYPLLRPGAAGGPTAPNGGGDARPANGGKTDEIAQVREDLAKAEKSGNRVVAASLQSRLTELTKG